MPAVELSKKDEKFREYSLHAPMWRVILNVGTPLALYEMLNQLFKILDTMMASHIGSSSVSAVAYLSQINMMISAIGSGLAVGAGIKICEAYGAGDYKLVKKRVSSLYAVAGCLGLLFLAVLLPLSGQLLRLAGTPQELIDVGARYFALEIISMVLVLFNTVYITVERARGNTRKILYLNFLVIGLKLSLTACFVYVLDGDLVMIAIASMIANGVLSLIALFEMLTNRDGVFGFAGKEITFRNKVTGPMIVQSIPVVVEKMAFAFGKVVVNSMCTLYGALMVGALGVSNNIGGITTNPQNGFQSGAASIIGQNMGAKQYKRVLQAFYATLVINLILGAVVLAFTMWQMDFVSSFFDGNDSSFHEMIKNVYRYEAWGAVLLGSNASAMALLYGMGKTKITLVLNFARVFIFRIPVLWLLQNCTAMGDKSVGMVMMISNIMAAVSSGIAAGYYVRKLKKMSQ